MTAVICDRCRVGIESCPCCGNLVCDNCVTECDRCGNCICKECADAYGVCVNCRVEEEEENG